MMIDIRPLKVVALKAPEPVKSLLLALPDEINKQELTAKMDVILKLMEEGK
ncbi:MAG: hypothetical protein QXP36_10295 [Conexivisphaerales archaeon]